MKAPRRVSGSRIAVGAASVGLTVGAFSLTPASDMAARPRRAWRSTASGRSRHWRPHSVTERIARLGRPPRACPHVTFPAWGSPSSYDPGGERGLRHARLSRPPADAVERASSSTCTAAATSRRRSRRTPGWSITWPAGRGPTSSCRSTRWRPTTPGPRRTGWCWSSIGARSRRTRGSGSSSWGDSAGGGLAAVIALSLAEAGDAQPDELALISPWVDITNTNPDIADYVDADPLMAPEPLAEIGRSWAGSTPPTDWHLSPIYGDLSGLKKVTTFVGTREILLPDNALFHAKLLEAGVDSTLHVGETSTTSTRCSPPRRDAGHAETSSASSPVSSPNHIR